MVDERHFERLFRDEDATPCSFDNIFHGPEVVTKNDQLSLINAFWCTTLFCVIMGLHSFVGPVFSIGIVIAVIVYLVLRIFPCNYAVTGGGACVYDQSGMFACCRCYGWAINSQSDTVEYDDALRRVRVRCLFDRMAPVAVGFEFKSTNYQSAER